MATYNVPAGPNVTLAAVLANGADAGTATITAASGTKTIWDGTTKTVPKAVLGGPAGSLSAYPLVPGTDTNHDTAAGVGAIATTAPAASIATYPLHPGTDVNHDTAAGVGAIATTAPAASITAYPLAVGTDVTGVGKVVAKAVATELTATTATTVLTFTPTANGVFIITAVVTVKTATTTLTLQATWTDAASLTAETYTFDNAASLPVGTRLELPIVIVASSTAAITLVATAGTANQVYISGSIEELV